jgi:hypothetical protein
LGLAGEGMIEDGFAALSAGFGLDFSEWAPVSLRFGAPVRLRVVDRAPQQPDVVRGRDWDEVGDYFVVLERFSWRGEFVFPRHGRVATRLWLGNLQNARLGHGGLVRGIANSVDLDRRRLGLATSVRTEGRILSQPAGVETELLATDVAGGQVLGGRVGLDWAGAGIGYVVAGDVLAPHRLVVGSDPTTLRLDHRGSLMTEGPRGTVGHVLELSYRLSDGHRYWVSPYTDLVAYQGRGRGLHTGIDAEGVLGPRRRARLGGEAELTVGNGDYDPVYFDVFYLVQRWQVPFVGTPGARPADLGDFAQTKHQFVRSADLSGVGGAGAIRYAHSIAADAGAFAAFGYRWRPGPLGGTADIRVGVAMREVELSLLWAHRGRHGFEVIDPAGTLTQFQLRVPAARWMDVTAAAGWLFAMRADPPGTTAAAERTGLASGAALLHLGVLGRFPW